MIIYNSFMLITTKNIDETSKFLNSSLHSPTVFLVVFMFFLLFAQCRSLYFHFFDLYCLFQSVVPGILTDIVHVILIFDVFSIVDEMSLTVLTEISLLYWLIDFICWLSMQIL